MQRGNVKMYSGLSWFALLPVTHNLMITKKWGEILTDSCEITEKLTDNWNLKSDIVTYKELR